MQAMPDADESIDSRLTLAAALVADDKSEAARRVLDALVASRVALTLPQANQIEFLFGLIAMAESKYAVAARQFRHMLAANPEAVRVRLELGRTLFLANQFQESERQFLLAGAGHLPPEVRENVDDFLGLIRLRKQFAWTFSLATEVDSNRNGGPASDSVTLFGLPFQLSPGTRASPGVGAVVDAGAEWTNNPGHVLRWRVGGVFHRAQYQPTRYDDMTLGGYFGPRLTVGHWDLGVTGTITRRWYGDRVYDDSRSGAADVTWFATRQFGLGAELGFSYQRYAVDPVESGPARDATVSVFWVPGPTSVLRGTASLQRQQAGDPAYASHGVRFGLAYMREFPGGLTLTVAPEWTRIGYDDVLYPFGVLRTDHQLSAEASLTHRGLVWHGLVPRITVAETINASTVELYRFHRTRIGLGVTRAF